MRTKRAIASTLSLSLGFALGTAMLAGSRLRPDTSGELLGDLDFFAYCATRYAETSRAVLYGNDAFGWRCMVFEPLYSTPEINTDVACSTLFHVRAEARTDDPSSPYQWRCYRI